mmetsp:Transcript_14825/g.40563  ORF Transcript_14825/g.40563 Transcript_14825/m.40563 type:complete len:83 (-) Transcript_14825:513-761(-)
MILWLSLASRKWNQKTFEDMKIIIYIQRMRCVRWQSDEASGKQDCKGLNIASMQRSALSALVPTAITALTALVRISGRSSRR